MPDDEGTSSHTVSDDSRLPAWLQRGLQFSREVLDALFIYELEGNLRWIAVLWIMGLFLLGCLLWWYFLNGGVIQLELHDWGEVTSHRYAFLQDAARQLKFPLHMPGFWALRNLTDRFYSIPDTPMSPQFFLLRYFDIGKFVLLNVLVLYSFGFVGILVFRKHYQVSLVVTTFFTILYFFNGHIIAHIAVGHANWSAYLILPWFILLVFKILDLKKPWRLTLFTSFLLFVIYLQGAFHLFVICLLFLGLLGITNWKYFPITFRIVVFSLFLSAVRILPSLLILQEFDTDFLSGFTSVGEMIAGTSILIGPTRMINLSPSLINPLGWWELNYYVGILGVAFILIFGIFLWIKNKDQYETFSPLILPVILLLGLSIGRIYKIFHLLHIPLLSSQRVSSRLFILPLLILIAVACIHLQTTLNQRKLGVVPAIGILTALLLAMQDLWQHLKLWRVVNMDLLFPSKNLNLSLDVISNHIDSPYTSALFAGFAITLLTALILVASVIVENRQGKLVDSSTSV